MYLFQVCIRSSQRLNYMINSRDLTILTEPELSVLKVSQLERVQFHDPEKYKLHEIQNSPRSAAVSTQKLYLESLTIISIWIMIKWPTLCTV